MFPPWTALINDIESGYLGVQKSLKREQYLYDFDPKIR